MGKTVFILKRPRFQGDRLKYWTAAICTSLALAALLLTGCAHYAPKPIDPATSGAMLESRTLSDAGLRAYLEDGLKRQLVPWPPRSWNLELLTLVAFYYHPSLDVARAERDRARAGVETAGAHPNPALTFVPEFSTNPPTDVSPWLPSVGIDLLIETAGKRQHRLAQARALAQAAQLNVLTAAWGVRRNLRTALLDFDAARERASLLTEQLAVQERIVQLLGERHTVGAVAGSDVTSARARAARIRLDLQAVRASVADARVRVADALGIPVHALDGMTFTAGLDPTGGSALRTGEARRRALQSRTDLISALADYAAAQASLQLEIARQYPNIHLGPGYQWDQGERKWRLALSLELPIRNRNEGPIAEAEAGRAEVAARFVALQAKVISEVDHATAALEVAEEASRSGDNLLRTQEEQLQSLRAQQQAGAADAMDVAGAQADYLAAQVLAADARSREIQALGALEDAVQWPLGSEAEVHSLQQQIDSTEEAPR